MAASRYKKGVKLQEHLVCFVGVVASPAEPIFNYNTIPGAVVPSQNNSARHTAPVHRLKMQT